VINRDDLLRLKRAFGDVGIGYEPRPLLEFVAFADFNGDRATDIIAFNDVERFWDVRLANGFDAFDKFGGGVWLRNGTVGFAGGDLGEVEFHDFDGDRRIDIIGFDDITHRWDVRLSSGTAFNNDGSGPWLQNGATGFAGGDLTEVAFHDFDGPDQFDVSRTDIIGFDETSKTWDVRLSSGTAFNAPGSGTGWLANGPTGFAGGDIADVAFHDFDGDGKTDIIGFSTADGQWDVRLSSGIAFDKVGGGPHWLGNNFAGGDITKVAFHDFDGDGNTDIIGFDEGSGQWDVRLSNGFDAFDKAGGGAQWLGNNFAGGDIAKVSFHDFDGPDANGVSTTDIIAYNDANGRWDVRLSNGADGFNKAGSGFWTQVPESPPDRRFFDFNADRCTDTIQSPG